MGLFGRWQSVRKIADRFFVHVIYAVTYFLLLIGYLTPTMVCVTLNIHTFICTSTFKINPVGLKTPPSVTVIFSQLFWD